MLKWQREAENSISSRAITTTICDALDKLGFYTYDIEFGNGYFIFEHGEDMVVHFHIKECPRWKFGIWYREPDNEEEWEDGYLMMDFFAQYETTIDKFKPAASTFVVKDVLVEKGDRSFVEMYLLNMIKFIHQHPIMSYAIDGHYQNYIWDYADSYYHGLKSIKRYYRDRYFLEYRLPKVREKLNKKYLKLLNDVLSVFMVDYDITDLNEDGWIVSPRYAITSSKGLKDLSLKDLPTQEEDWRYTIGLDELTDVELRKEWIKFKKYYLKLCKRGCYYAEALRDIESPDYIEVVIKKGKKGGKNGRHKSN